MSRWSCSRRALRMVLFFTSTALSPPCFIYMGKDKVESASRPGAAKGSS